MSDLRPADPADYLVQMTWDGYPATWDGEPLVIDPLEWDLILGDLLASLRRIGDAGAHDATSDEVGQ